MFQEDKTQSTQAVAQELEPSVQKEEKKKSWEDVRHIFGENTRIVVLAVSYVLFVLFLFFTSGYQIDRILSIGDEDLKNAEKVESVIAYLAPESRVTLMVEKTDDDVSEFSSKRVDDWQKENLRKLKELPSKLESIDYKAIENWPMEKRDALLHKLSEKQIEKWIDLSNWGILQNYIYGKAQDAGRLANSRVNIPNEDPIPVTSLLTIDKMIDLMISDVDVWGDDREAYRALFQEIGLQPTLSELEPIVASQATKKPQIVESGEFLLKKGCVPTKEEIKVFKAYQNKLKSRSHWGHDVLFMITLALSILAFRHVLSRGHTNGKLSNLYPYFPLLAVFMGFVTNSLTMILVLFFEAQFPFVANYLPLKYGYVIYPMLLPTILISMIYHYDTHVTLFTGLFNAILLAGASICGMHTAILMGMVSTFITCVLASKIKDERSSRLYTFISHFSSAFLTLAILSGFEWYSGKDIIAKDFFGQIGYVVCFIFIASVLISFFLTPVCVFIMELFGADTRIIYSNLSNQSNKMMKELAKEAPGTYYHCVKVANMAVFAAEQMSNVFDPTAIYACAMYHDIGKLVEPKVYTENGGDLDNLNLTYMEKAEKIRKHVTNGVNFAIKHHFPHLIVEVIRTHHGTDSISYFYQKAKEVGEIDPNDPTQAEQFHYEGPNPETPEAFLIGMADACEAAVKSMKGKFTEESITNMVNKVFEKRRENHFMENANVKIAELKVMKRAFVEHLMGEVKRLNYENKLKETDSPEKKS